MDEWYRLQLFDPHGACFAINWANVYENGRFATGDCVVRAIRATTDVDTHNHARHQLQRYTEPMSLGDVRRYITEHPMMLGAQIHDCVGVVLEDADDCIITFGAPIQVRTA